jgi:hypothetical protein
MATAALAVTYYVSLIESECKVQGLFKSIGGLIQSFIEEVLFQEPISMYDARLEGRLGDPDVATHVLAVFVPLVRERTTQTEVRAPELPPVSLKDWKPYKASHSDRNPCKAAGKTLFNLVPCRGRFGGGARPGARSQGQRHCGLRQECRAAGAANRLRQGQRAAQHLHPRTSSFGARTARCCSSRQRAARTPMYRGRHGPRWHGVRRPRRPGPRGSMCTSPRRGCKP